MERREKSSALAGAGGQQLKARVATLQQLFESRPRLVDAEKSACNGYVHHGTYRGWGNAQEQHWGPDFWRADVQARRMSSGHRVRRSVEETWRRLEKLEPPRLQ